MKPGVLTVFAMTAVTAVVGAPLPAAAQLKVAVIENLSGPGSATNRLFAVGMKTGLTMVNQAGGWKGQPIEYLEYDNQGAARSPPTRSRPPSPTARTSSCSGGSSAIGGQITEDVRKHNLRNPGQGESIYINVGAEASELHRREVQLLPLPLRQQRRDPPQGAGDGDEGSQARGHRVYAINQNYSWGQDMERPSSGNAGPVGYTVVDKVLHDVNKIQDFAPTSRRSSRSNAATVITGNWGSDLLLLMKAVGPSGLKVRFGTVLPRPAGQRVQRRRLGDRPLHRATFYLPEAGGAAAKALFVVDYKAKSGHAADHQRSRVRPGDGRRCAEGSTKPTSSVAPT